MVIKNGKVVIHAVHERDAKGVWKKLKLKDVEKCLICNKDVTYDTFGALTPWEGEVRVICESLNCLYELNTMKRNKMIGVSDMH